MAKKKKKFTGFYSEETKKDQEFNSMIDQILLKETKGETVDYSQFVQEHDEDDDEGYGEKFLSIIDQALKVIDSFDEEEYDDDFENDSEDDFCDEVTSAISNLLESDEDEISYDEDIDDESPEDSISFDDAEVSSDESIESEDKLSAEYDPDIIDLEVFNAEDTLDIYDNFGNIQYSLKLGSLLANIPGEKVPDDLIDDDFVRMSYMIARGPLAVMKEDMEIYNGAGAVKIGEFLKGHNLNIGDTMKVYSVTNPATDEKVYLFYVVSPQAEKEITYVNGEIYHSKRFADFWQSFLVLLGNKLVNPLVEDTGRWEYVNKEETLSDADVIEVLSNEIMKHLSTEEGQRANQKSHITECEEISEVFDSIAIELETLNTHLTNSLMEGLNEAVNKSSNVSVVRDTETITEDKIKAAASKPVQKENIITNDDKFSVEGVQSDEDEEDDEYVDSDDIDDVEDGEDILSSGEETDNQFIVQQYIPPKK